MENTFMLEFRYMIRCIELDAKHKYYSNTYKFIPWSPTVTLHVNFISTSSCDKVLHL